MPNCWHLVVWPREDGELSRFVGWLTWTHTQRGQAQRRSTDSGHVCQGRFKSLPIEQDERLYAVARYVEPNALRASLVRRADQWRGGSLDRRRRGTVKDGRLPAAWPSARKANRVD